MDHSNLSVQELFQKFPDAVQLLVCNLPADCIDPVPLKQLFSDYGFLSSQTALDPYTGHHRFYVYNRCGHVAVVKVQSRIHANKAIFNLNERHWGDHPQEVLIVCFAREEDYTDENGGTWHTEPIDSPLAPKETPFDTFTDWWKSQDPEHFAAHKQRLTSEMTRHKNCVFFNEETWTISHTVPPWGEWGISGGKEPGSDVDDRVQLIDWEATRNRGFISLKVNSTASTMFPPAKVSITKRCTRRIKSASKLIIASFGKSSSEHKDPETASEISQNDLTPKEEVKNTVSIEMKTIKSPRPPRSERCTIRLVHSEDDNDDSGICITGMSSSVPMDSSSKTRAENSLTVLHDLI